ncbi:MAG TPA: helix-turn-helix transcriptional regulator [Chloroflexota bacterium]|nr:helix-turn-helix transcriptional regulator [Chloroflexota bacterium]
MEPEGIGLRIRRRRESLGLTLKQAAGRAGINTGTLSSIELYYVNRVPSRLPEIARALETSVAQLMGSWANN